MNANKAVIVIFLIALSFQVGTQERWVHAYNKLELASPMPVSVRILMYTDQGYLGILESRYNDMFTFFKIDTHGNLLWVKKFPSIDFANLVDKGDGTFFMIAENIYGPPSIGTWLVTFDKDGKAISQQFNDSAIFSIARKVPDDNSYILSGWSSLAFARLNLETGIFRSGKYYVFNDSGNFFVGSKAIAMGNDNVFIVGSEIANSSSLATVIKVDLDGNLVWAKSYEGFYEPIISSTLDGGFLLTGVTFYIPGTIGVLQRMDANGDILWQERLVFPDYPNMLEAYILGMHECDDGTILIRGLTGDDDSSSMEYQSFIALLNSAGEPLWCQVYENGISFLPTYTTEDTIMETEDSILAAGLGKGEYEDINFVSPAIISVDKTGISPDLCPPTTIRMEAKPTYYNVSDVLLTACDLVPLPMKNLDANIEDITLGDHLLCGDVWPAVLSAKKFSNPFRLKLTGWNFTQESEVYVNGVKTPKASYKGTDAYNHTKLVVSGAGLKTLLPKGQPVCITVKNPDGHESECFSYTR